MGPRWVVPFVLLSISLSDRAFLLVATGGQGMLPLIVAAAPAAAIVAIWRLGFRRCMGYLEHPVFLFGVLPYLALSAVLPILGVVVHGYPERTLLSVADTTTALSFITLGAAVSPIARREWTRWLPVVIVLQFAYAAGQAISWSRGPGWELFAPFAEWDLSLAALEGQLGSIGRSTGLFTNPNELGLWASCGAVAAWTLLTGRWRVVGVTLSLMTLLLSQARGPAVGLVAAVVAMAVVAVVRGRLSRAAALRTGLTLASAGLIVWLAVTLQLVDVPLERFGALLRVLTEGPQADPNLAGRLGLWSGVLTLNLAYPWGTWGSPELLLGAAVDSAWFRAFAQGSVFYVAALGVLFAAAFVVRDAAHGDALRLTSVVLAVVGVTQTSLNSPVTTLLWVLLGIYLQASMTDLRSRRKRSFGAGAMGTQTDTRPRAGRRGSSRLGSGRVGSSAG